MHKFLTLCSVLVTTATSFSSPVRDDLAARGTSSTSDRPYAAIIEYLESTGTQWIDTGITASTEIRPLELGVRVIRNGYFFGGGDSSGNGFGFQTRSMDVDSFTIGLGWTSTLNYWNTAYAEPYDIVGVLGNTFRVNGRRSNTIPFHASYDYTFALFGRNIGGIVTPCPVRIYFAKIGELDLLPVRIGNEGFLYDQVSGLLFGNSGTGSFILGPDIAPLEY